MSGLGGTFGNFSGLDVFGSWVLSGSNTLNAGSTISLSYSANLDILGPIFGLGSVQLDCTSQHGHDAIITFETAPPIGSSFAFFGTTGNALRLPSVTGASLSNAITGFTIHDTITLGRDLSGDTAVYVAGTGGRPGELIIRDGLGRTAFTFTDFREAAGGYVYVTVVGSSIIGTVGHSVTIASPTHSALLLDRAVQNPVSITSSGAILSTGSYGIKGLSNLAWTIRNEGTVQATGAGAVGIELVAGGTITNSGTVQATGAGAVGIELVAGGTITNSGTISANVGISFGAKARGDTITNDGMIIGSGGTAISLGGTDERLVVGVGSRMQGVALGGSSDILEVAGTAGGTIAVGLSGNLGTITPAGAPTDGSVTFGGFANVQLDGGTWHLSVNSIASGIAIGGDGTLDVTSLANAGTIAAVLDLANGFSLSNAGLIARYGPPIISPGSGIFVNTGTIEYSVVYRGTFGDAMAIAGYVRLTNLGLISGSAVAHDVFYDTFWTNGISLGSGLVVNGSQNDPTAMIFGWGFGLAIGSGQVFNFGTIGGHYGAGLSLGAGELTNGTSADRSANIFSGVVFGNGTIINFGTIAGGGGYVDRYIYEYSRNGLIIGTGQVTNMVGALIENGLTASGVTTIENGGIINGYPKLPYPKGNQYIGVDLMAGGSVTNLAGGVIEGRIGVDTGAGGSTTMENAGTIIGTSGTAVQFGSGVNRLIVDPGAVFVGTVLGGTAGNIIELASSASVGTLTGLGSSFVNFGSIVLDAGADWFLTGSNTASGSVQIDASAVLTISGGLLLNGGTITNSGTVVEVGSLAVPLSFARGGSLTNAQGGVISGIRYGIAFSAGAGVIVNGGRLRAADPATLPGTPSYVVAMHAGGTIINTGIIAGYLYTGGIYTGGGAATITNAGLIESGAGTGSLGKAISKTGVVLNGGGVLTNETGGTIAGSLAGVILSRPGTVTNLGLIQGGGISNAGVFLGASAAGSLIINGASSSPTATISGHSFGIQVLANGVTVSNAGTVSGAVSVQLRGSGDRLIVDPGAVFNGSVQSSLTSNILELASGVGQIKGLGTNFTGFGTVVVDSGGAWSVTGDNTLASASTTILGELIAAAGTLALGGTVAGSGTLALATNSVLIALSAVQTTTLAFLSGGGETLQLGNPLAITSTITGFDVAGDRIDLLKSIGTSVSVTGHVLTVHGTGGAVATLHFAGNYTAKQFSLSSDSHSGTDLRFT